MVGYYNTRQLHDEYACVPPMGVMCEQSDAPVNEYDSDAHQTVQMRPAPARHVHCASSFEGLPERWILQRAISPPFPQSLYLSEHARSPNVL